MNRPQSRPDSQTVVKLTAIDDARSVLRARGATTQAGFTSERIPSRMFRRRPILIDDGPRHDEHRKQLARFFAPRVLRDQHGDFIERTAQELVSAAQRDQTCKVDELALLFSVRVASRIVGLTHGSTDQLAARLTAFFRQPPVDHTRPDHGRTQRQWMLAARNALAPLVSFYFADVRPAVRARRKAPRDDIISFLLERGYRPREILMECLTYGTAGMVTTREFICMALLRLLEQGALRERYLVAGEVERMAILNEIIRLEPPVSHLYRRVREKQPACPYDEGSLVDIDVRQANLDESLTGDSPRAVCPDRGLNAADQPGLSFGDGAHRCPGSKLALIETDALLRALLHANPVIRSAPRQGFDSLVQGYQLRDFTIAFDDGIDASADS